MLLKGHYLASILCFQFLKGLATVTGKDVQTFIELWMYPSSEKERETECVSARVACVRGPGVEWLSGRATAK